MTHLLRTLGALAALALAACATPRFTHAPAAGEQLSAATDLFERHDYKGADAILRPVLASSSFDGLPSADRYRALMLAGRCEVLLGQTKLAYGYWQRASQMSEATFEDQAMRVRLAVQLGDEAGEVAGLTAMASRWPARAGELKQEYVTQVPTYKDRLPHAATMPLLQALYDAHWTLRWGIEPSGAWRDLALLLIEEGKLTQATVVSERVTLPYVLIGMRADRRFDALTHAHPERFDIDAAQKREIELLQAEDSDGPRSLEVKDLLIDALLNEQRFGVGLAISDSVSDDIRSTNFPERLYSDYDEQYVDFLGERAQVLEHVGRFDDALAELTLASPMFERGRDNVSEVLELAQLYCDLGHPQEGLKTLAGVGSDLSPFGLMQAEASRLDAGAQLGDAKQVERSLDFLRKHRSDGSAVYLWALLTANRTDLAAQELIRELRDVDRRTDTLVAVQTYLAPPGTPRETELYARWRAVIARPEVQAEIGKVGRIGSYPLEAPGL